MKLAAKFTILLIIAVLVLITVDGYLVVQRDIGMFDKDMQRDAIQFCERIEPQIEAYFREGGEEKVVEFLADLNASNSEFDVQDFEFFSVKWVILDANSDEPYRPMAARDELQPAFGGREYLSLRYEVQGNVVLMETRFLPRVARLSPAAKRLPPGPFFPPMLPITQLQFLPFHQPPRQHPEGF